MPRHNSLAQLELFVLLSLFRQGGEGFGGELQREIRGRSGRNVSLAAVFVTLARLEERGLLASRITDPRPVPGGRARKRFLLNKRGLDALQTAIGQLRGLLENLPDELVLETR